MGKQNKDFYVWTLQECIKDTYEWWGTDMTSMYDNIKRDFPNVTRAIPKMHSDFKTSNFYDTKPLKFENIQFIYEAISNLVPTDEKLKFDLRTKEQSKDYKYLNICSWNEFISINRIDLIIAVLLFTEEFILQPISSRNVVLTDKKITVYGSFVTFKVSKHEDKTYISIRIRNVMLLEYVILN